MLEINCPKFWKTMIPALVVMMGVIIKNSSEQYAKNKKEKPNNIYFYVGMAIFILGWIGVAFAIALNEEGTGMGTPKKIALSFVSSTMIVVAVALMMITKKKEGEMPKWATMMVIPFIIGWLLLGYTSSIGQTKPALWLGLGSAVLVIISMVGALPWQRKNGVIDGPGMALFAFAWVLLATANSIQ